jgi:hypothetical protein
LRRLVKELSLRQGRVDSNCAAMSASQFAVGVQSLKIPSYCRLASSKTPAQLRHINRALLLNQPNDFSAPFGSQHHCTCLVANGMPIASRAIAIILYHITHNLSSEMINIAHFYAHTRTA